MFKVKDIVEYVESLSGHILHSDEGVQYGDFSRSIEKVLVCWMPTFNALKKAGKIGSDLVIAHESLYYPYNAVAQKNQPAE
jgi:putative NIF3 family GTP cyclohydrolase 1 type 2